MSDNKYVKKISDVERERILQNSVAALSAKPTLNATEMKMRFVKPIIDTDKDAPSIAKEIDRVADETDAALQAQEQTIDSIDNNVIAIGSKMLEIESDLGGVQQKVSSMEDEITGINITLAPIPSQVYDVNMQLASVASDIKYGKVSYITASIDSSNYVMTLTYYGEDGFKMGSTSIDLPLESMVVGAEYNKDIKSLILRLKSGESILVPLEDIFSGLLNESEKGAANGIAPLDEDAKIPSQYLPDDIGGGASNIENGNGTNSVQQKASSGVENGFSFSDKTNAAAVEHDSTLNGTVPYGAQNDYSASFGCKSSAQGRRSFASGSSTVAKGDYSHTEGSNGVAFGVSSHVEGAVGTAIGDYSHVEGSNGVAKGTSSHVEGMTNTAEGNGSHGEGWNNTVKGNYAHAEGSNNTVGENAHSAHVSGQNNNVNYEAQAVFGRYNKNKPNNILEVGYGDGDAPSQRKNVFEVDKDGEAYAGGTRLLKYESYIVITSRDETNGYKVPDDVDFIFVTGLYTSDITNQNVYDTVNKRIAGMGGISVAVRRGGNYNSMPLRLDFTEEGYLIPSSTGPTNYTIFVKLIRIDTRGLI